MAGTMASVVWQSCHLMSGPLDKVALPLSLTTRWSDSLQASRVMTIDMARIGQTLRILPSLSQRQGIISATASSHSAPSSSMCFKICHTLSLLYHTSARLRLDRHTRRLEVIPVTVRGSPSALTMFFRLSEPCVLLTSACSFRNYSGYIYSIARDSLIKYSNPRWRNW